MMATSLQQKQPLKHVPAANENNLSTMATSLQQKQPLKHVPAANENSLSMRATSLRARKIFEFHLAHWASNPQILLARGTSLLAQVFKLINNS